MIIIAYLALITYVCWAIPASPVAWVVLAVFGVTAILFIQDTVRLVLEELGVEIKRKPPNRQRWRNFRRWRNKIIPHWLRWIGFVTLPITAPLLLLQIPRPQPPPPVEKKIDTKTAQIEFLETMLDNLHKRGTSK